MPMTKDYVVVTGASKGIGAETARLFAAAGAHVALLARDGGALSALAADIGPNALALPCDVSDAAAVARAVQQAEEAQGPATILINNAGVIDPIAPMDSADPDAWGHLIDINVKGVFYGMNAVLPGMITRGGGSILTVSSGAAHNPVEGWSAYCASKAAVAMMTRSLHHEYAGRGVRAMGLSPGTVATNMQRVIKSSGVGPVAMLDWDDHIPADWPARALLWMASPDADEFCGTEIALRDTAIRKRVGLI